MGGWCCDHQDQDEDDGEDKFIREHSLFFVFRGGFFLREKRETEGGIHGGFIFVYFGDGGG